MTALVFDRTALRRHRDRAAADFAAHDFLFRETAERLAERLDFMARPFPVAVDLGCRTGLFAPLLHGRAGIETLLQIEASPGMLARAEGLRVQADEDFLPLAPASVDLIVSNLALHWVNDLPGALLQIRQALKPGGLFLANLFGGETLAALRHALLTAELDLRNGASPRVSPVVDMADAATLMQRAGFAEPVVDGDLLDVSYPHLFKLMSDLRGMGETDCQILRGRHFTPRSLFMRAAQIYAETAPAAPGPTGEARIQANFQLITLTGWAGLDDQIETSNLET